MAKLPHHIARSDLWRVKRPKDSTQPILTSKDLTEKALVNTTLDDWYYLEVRRNRTRKPYRVVLYKPEPWSLNPTSHCYSKVEDALEFANALPGRRYLVNRPKNPFDILLARPSTELLQVALTAAAFVASGTTAEYWRYMFSNPTSAEVIRGHEGTSVIAGNRLYVSTVAWWTDNVGNRFVRIRSWCKSHYASEPPLQRKGSCWDNVYPERSQKLHDAVRRRTIATLERIGPPGQDDRLNIREPVVAARSPEGIIIADRRKWPRVAQVVVRDATTGLRHHIGVPIRFANARRPMGSDAARVHAAIAWTFNLKPDQYSPLVEA